MSCNQWTWWKCCDVDTRRSPYDGFFMRLVVYCDCTRNLIIVELNLSNFPPPFLSLENGFCFPPPLHVLKPVVQLFLNPQIFVIPICCSFCLCARLPWSFGTGSFYVRRAFDPTLVWRPPGHGYFSQRTRVTARWRTWNNSLNHKIKSR